jgi:hypothetical protein
VLQVAGLFVRLHPLCHSLHPRPLAGKGGGVLNAAAAVASTSQATKSAASAFPAARVERTRK